jgi:hypothetical protein
MALNRQPGPGRGGGGAPTQKTKTVQYRKWKGINLTDARVAIDDDEMSWQENALTIGNGAIQILRHEAPPLVSIGAGIDTLWGFTLKAPGAILMTVNSDGSMSQITVPAGAVTPVAPPGTFSGGHDTHLSIWQNTPILIIDPVKGYFWWDGTALGGNVKSGGEVDAHVAPDMGVRVMAGTANFWNTLVIPWIQQDLVVPASDPTNPRIDIVTIDNTGTAIYTTGTPAVKPVPPAPPFSGGFQNIVLAQVSVIAGATTIIQGAITDLRAFTTLTGSTIATFEGRVFTSSGRVITYSAPNSYIDFTAPNGGGTATITDEAFEGDIVALVSALEELWIIGHGAIDALANVTAVGTAPNVATSFSITNILTNVGTNAPHSVQGYFRALTLLAPFGIYALSGVTPQKLSDKLDGLFPDLVLDDRISAAVAVVENLLCLFFLATYTGNQAQAGPPPIPLLIGFVQGKMFLAVQGLSLTWITTLLVDGVAQAWGTDGSQVYRLFGADASVPTTYKVQGKLSDQGQATTEKALMKVGFEFQATLPINPKVTMDSESISVQVPLTTSNEITAIVNNAGVDMTLINDSGDPLTILTQGLILAKEQTSLFGHYIGWTISGNDPPYRLQAIEEEFALTREWQGA